jgi:hypothetical protein
MIGSTMVRVSVVPAADKSVYTDMSWTEIVVIIIMSVTVAMMTMSIAVAWPVAITMVRSINSENAKALDAAAVCVAIDHIIDVEPASGLARVEINSGIAA